VPTDPPTGPVRAETRAPASPAGWLRALGFCLGLSRFSVLSLLAGLALLLSGQGRDLLTAYGDDGKTVRVAAATMAWAWSIWFWCRALLNVRYEDPPSCRHCYNVWRLWLPRVLGSLAFLALAESARRAGQGWLAVWALGGLVSFLAVVIARRPVTRRAVPAMLASRHVALRSYGRSFEAEEIGPESLPPHADLLSALGIPGAGRRGAWQLRGILAVATTLLLAGLLAAGTFAPGWLGGAGAMILVFAWGASCLPAGSALSYLADRRGWPLFTLLVGLSLLSSFFNDNHRIRVVGEPGAPSRRPSVTAGLVAWGELNRVSREGERPLVVVATAGGGIRAAYWTATLLGRLDQEAPTFSRRLFALSGVSGGSVGATVYRALLAVPRERLGACGGTLEACGQQVLRQEVLGPLAAALLYPDLAQRFVPLAVFPDRAEAFERAFEAAFRRVLGIDELGSPLCGLGAGAGPSLFLNATSVERGRRLVASNLRMDRSDPSEAAAFVRASDELAVIGRDLRLSTAAHNSARFPYVSPAGSFPESGPIAGRLQDGGLFENFGAETALEVLHLACLTYACPEPGGEPAAARPRIRPLVVLISSDPAQPRDVAESPVTQPLRAGAELFSTLETYEHVRVGRGTEAASRLEDWTRHHGGAFFHLRMCPSEREIGSPPLGWALSEEAQRTIQGYLDGPPSTQAGDPGCSGENRRSVATIVELLASAAGAERP
jgi:hypothetical protein